MSSSYTVDYMRDEKEKTNRKKGEKKEESAQLYTPALRFGFDCVFTHFGYIVYWTYPAHCSFFVLDLLELAIIFMGLTWFAL